MSDAASDAIRREEIRIWDVPIRLFHWSLALLLGLAWWTGEERLMEWHRLTGYAILSLIAWRLVWGFCGSSTARFRDFVKGPKAVLAYLGARGDTRYAAVPGHNPAGGWSVLVMLGLLAAQVVLGLFSVDIDGLESGPLSYLVDFDTGRTMALWHARIFTALQVAVAAHVLAIAYYLFWRRQNLTAAMITGRRAWPGKERPDVRFVPAWRGVVWFAIVVALLLVALEVAG